MKTRDFCIIEPPKIKILYARRFVAQNADSTYRSEMISNAQVENYRSIDRHSIKARHVRRGQSMFL